uniref:Peptidase S8/S53 domain-containing protein n=1 Tax=Bionectria ochroleuca TaxID=29856 RepID=A0A8H7NGM5_BIOOC
MMKGAIWSAIVAPVASLVQAAPVEVDADIIPNQFIVQLRPGIPASAILEHHQVVRDLHSRGLSQRDGVFFGLGKTFSAGDFNAYAGTFDSATIAEIAALPEVLKWHLGSISHRAENSTEYIYDDSAAEGTFAYVVDSGIRWSHEEFERRASFGYNAVNGSENVDWTGHGTHVASILAGKTYGVAKKATVIDVKVFHWGSSTSATIIDGITWAVNDIVANNRQHLSVINLSLDRRTPPQDVLDNAVKNIYNLGILPVCAAGNENVDVSTRSPGRTPECLTVGNVEPSLRKNKLEEKRRIKLWRSSGHLCSRYRRCGGVSTKRHRVHGGHGDVTGCPCGGRTRLVLPEAGGLATPDEVINRIIELSTKDVVTEAKGSQNRLAYNGNA